MNPPSEVDPHQELLNKLENYKTLREVAFTQLQATYDASKATGATSISTFLARCSELEAIRDRFTGYVECISEINAQLPTVKKLAIDASVTAFDQVYYEIRATESAFRNRFENKPPPIPDIRLPRLDVPIWDGQLSTFSNWFALFNSVIHRGPYSNTVKFTYLRSLLTGSPLKMIESMEISSDNYGIAYNKIEQTYANERVLASFYVENMLEFKRMPNESVPELRSFLTVFDTNYKAFLNLDLPDHSDFFVLQCALRALPTSLRILFERSLSSSYEVPTFAQLQTFVHEQCRIKEFLVPAVTPSSSKSTKPSPMKYVPRSAASLMVTPTHSGDLNNHNPDITSSASASAQPPSCPVCNQHHSIYDCQDYQKMPVDQRYETIKSLKRCFRCLSRHSRSKCASRGTCRHCKSARHHSSLHNESFQRSESTHSTSSSTPNAPATSGPPSPSISPASTARTFLTGECLADAYVLLGTAQAFLRNGAGSWSPIRLVIDIGSQVNLISTECVQRLGLPTVPRTTRISGAMDQVVGRSQGAVSCCLAPSPNDPNQLCASAVVVSKICSRLPAVTLPQSLYDQFAQLKLADRSFHQRGTVDFLLGAGLYSDIFKQEFGIRHGEPAAIETIFGWVVFGSVNLPDPLSLNVTIDEISPDARLDELMQRFWQVEEVANVRHQDPLHLLAENHFKETHFRQPDGSYCVRLPFKPHSNLPPIGDSRKIAIRRWCNVEKRLQQNPQLMAAYNDFMEEYLALGHMVPAQRPGKFYIPHFGITRESSTSPLRVVFDGSCKDTSNVSLNERFLTGPPPQKDTCDVLMYFRLRAIAVTSDVKMMYRGVWVNEEDCVYQHIFWRASPKVPLREFELKTVTYGLAPAPFLALRSIVQLVEDEGAPYPEASRALLESTLVDDICRSFDTTEDAIAFRDQLIALMSRAKFELRKWASNSEEVLSDIPADHRAKVLTVRPDQLESLMILGLQWLPQDDCFSYRIRLPFCANTKRSISSQVMSIYDPLGWLAPTVLWAKCFLQELWSEGLDWDTPLPEVFATRWAAFSDQLEELSAVRIPRLCVSPSLKKRQLIGFCDGSTMGYAAVLYVRCSSPDESNVTVHLIKSKTKVAPLKVQTIPRLELNGAVLLANLVRSIQFVKEELEVSEVVLFTDASTVLAWLRTPTHLLKQYVANRVVHILDVAPQELWRHVPSAMNGADNASRGISPRQLLDDSSWWAGPEFLWRRMMEWPSAPNDISTQDYALELRKVVEPQVLNVIKTSTTKNSRNLLLNVIASHSSLTRLKRVLAYVRRFITNCRLSKTNHLNGPLTVSELQSAFNVCIQQTQQHYFSQEIRAIKKGRSVSKKLRSFSPYVDSDGFLRVGGRLANSHLPAHSKHPLLLPGNAPLAVLICDFFHVALLHAGPQATQSMIQREFWILSARPLIRKRIHKCLICYRSKAKMKHPVMGDLPASRVNAQPRAFTETAVDFAGPLHIKEHSRRNARLTKAYVCVFVCMATKAVHLELVSDLSTPAYQAALDRFIARRGLCSRIFCDQGTNFVGAANDLRAITSFLKDSEPALVDYLSTRQIAYAFNPPASPWMGGLWEAAVKSFKGHLSKITFNRTLTYEEMATFLARIEAVLNSRPLCPSTDDPADGANFLSPGHFLIGSPLLAAPEHDHVDRNENHLTRWQLVQRASQEFWRRWSREYLNTLIQRKKWTEPRPPLEIGQLVIIAKENTRSLDWPLGIIESVSPGPDGVQRVAQVRTQTGHYTRPVARLIPLPSD